MPPALCQNLINVPKKDGIYPVICQRKVNFIRNLRVRSSCQIPWIYWDFWSIWYPRAQKKYDSNKEIIIYSIIMEKFRLEVFQLYIPLDWMLYKTLLLQIQLIAKPWSAKPLYTQISDALFFFFFWNTSKSYHLIYSKFWLHFSVCYRMSTSCENHEILWKHYNYLRI